MGGLPFANPFALTSCRLSPWLCGVFRKRAPHSLLVVSRAEGLTFAWQPMLTRNACVFHGRRGDSPGFSLLVSDSGHPEVSIDLQLPVSESCLETLVVSGQQELIPVLTWCPQSGREGHAASDMRIGSETKEILSGACFLTLKSEKRAVFKESFLFSHKAMHKNFSHVKKKYIWKLDGNRKHIIFLRLVLRP